DNARAATQSLTEGQIVHDTLTVTSADGTTSQLIDVIVTGANDSAAISGTATADVIEAGTAGAGTPTASGTLSISDIDAGKADVIEAGTAGGGTPTASGTLTISDVDAGQAVFQAPASLSGTYGTFAFNTATGAWGYTLDNARAATQSLTEGQVVHDTLTVISA